jgi:hypothetical protein
VGRYHCGFERIWFEGRSWEVPEETDPYAGLRPPGWVGRGTVEPAAEGESLHYVDESGVTLTFVPADGLDPGCA